MGDYIAKTIDASILDKYTPEREAEADSILGERLSALAKKIVVLDDDPTGVQTVNNVHVYTNWSEESLESGFNEDNNIFFILTNSRGFTVPETKKAHIEIAENLVAVSKKLNKDFIVISRSDSTLRGHYPLETETLKEEIEKNTDKKFDGEIIFPFFKEGGRYTINNIHYVKDADKLNPAGTTEFAKDKSFGYKSSDLGLWCQEKTGGKFSADDMVYISLEDLRNFEVEKITGLLLEVKDFNKVIVNAVDYVDVKVFAAAFLGAVQKGKEFMFRSAAAITKVLGNVKSIDLLTKADLVDKDNKNGGIVLIGSHVNKTTLQLKDLMKINEPVEFFEFHAERVFEEGGLEDEVNTIVKKAEEFIKNGKSVVVYTSRKLIALDTDDKDKILEISVKISDCVTRVVGDISVKPSFIVAKGGITSSDVGTKALRVKKARVMGQIKPGIPVWMTGEESKFPCMPYVIFPGNVGEISTLREIVETLI